MIVTATSVPGVLEIEVERHRDERGWFARTYSREELSPFGVALDIVETSASWSPKSYTLRGMHYQLNDEPKLVRCTRGRVFDVAVDLRASSESYLSWVSCQLDSEATNALFIPPGVAHGFLTLADDCELLYYMGARHDNALSRGVRWNDPAFGINWPREPAVISERDANYPDHPE